MSKKQYSKRRHGKRRGWKHLLHLSPTRKTSHYLLPQGKQEFGRFLSRARRLSRRHDNRCVFVVSDNGRRCGEKSQGCHALSKSKVVEPLAGKNEKVVDFSWGVPEWGRIFLPSNQGQPVELWSEKEFAPTCTGRNDVTKTGFGCNPHDSNAFQILDGSASIDSKNKALLFLVAYRALLYTNSRLRQVYRLFDYKDLRKRIIRYRLLDQLPHLKNQRELLEKVNESVRNEVNRLGRIHYLYKDKLDSIPIDLTSRSQLFRSKLKFASTGLIDSTDTFHIILPHGDDPELHQLTIIQLDRPERTQSQEADNILSLAEQCLENSTNWITLFQHVLFTGSCTIASIDFL